MPIITNERALANRIVSDAKAAGLSPAEMQQLGQRIIENFNQASYDVFLLPAIREVSAQLANAIVMATNELAANTAPDPFVDGGVTA